ncbi:hypothetical protein KEM48_009544 [Puccinia striiformis f. sp. tritici PST-130]|nr:hypothetical protein KEM48_009544 [Puccinia striiformis f. sp. tritici PST-130]
MDESSAEKDVSRTNLPAIPDTSPPSSAFLTFLSGVLGNPNFRLPSGDVLIKQDTLNLIQQMILVEDTRLKKMELHMDAIDRHITLLELNRQPMASSSTQAAKPSYARATGNPAVLPAQSSPRRLDHHFNPLTQAKPSSTPIPIRTRSRNWTVASSSTCQ